MKRLFAFVGALLVAVPIAFAQTWPYFPPPGTGSGTSGQCLISGGAGVAPSWLSCSTGAGTVTSVALADASSTALYVISGSPVTTSGTLTETLATESPNFVLAGPASGVTAVQPTFRALVNADIPTALSGIAISGAAGSFTTLAASSTVSGTGFSTYLASPPAIGGTAAAAGAFTTITGNGAANINASNNAASNIGTGTTTSAVGIGGVDNVTNIGSPLNLTTAGGISANSWTTAGLALSGTAATLTDSTGTGTITTEAAAALPAYTIAATNTSVTITNLAELYLPAPVAGRTSRRLILTLSLQAAT